MSTSELFSEEISFLLAIDDSDDMRTDQWGTNKFSLLYLISFYQTYFHFQSSVFEINGNNGKVSCKTRFKKQSIGENSLTNCNYRKLETLLRVLHIKIKDVHLQMFVLHSCIILM